MANFNTHMTVSAAASMIATYSFSTAFQLSIDESITLFFLGTLAGLLPDIDADHSIPIRWMFRLLTLATALLVMTHWYHQLPLMELVLYATIAALCMRFVILKQFAHFTRHRGLFHSLPAALLFGLSMLSIALHIFAWPLYFSWLAAAFVGGGYLIHLMLDELFSVNLMGGELKTSFGSALTVINRESWQAYLLLYGIVIAGVISLPMPAAINNFSQILYTLLHLP